MSRMQSAVRALGYAVSAALALSMAASAPAAPVPDGAEWSAEEIRSRDGTRLHADVFRPAGAGRTPVILIPSRYFATGSGADPGQPRMLDYYSDIHERAYARGYSVVQLTPRGYGKSGGCTDWRGPGERDDVIAAIRWAADQPWSTGKVATYGLSYDGGLQVAALSQSVPGHAAAVPIGAVTSAYRGFYMRGVRYEPFAALGRPYTLAYTFPPADPADADAALVAAEGRLVNPGCILDTANWENRDPAAPYWRARDYEEAAARTRVPTLWSQGLLDWNVHADGLSAVWPRLAGPKRVWLGQHQHVVPSEAERGHPEVVGREGWTEEVFRFFDRHVKGIDAADDPRVVLQEGAEGGWRGEPTWPPQDARTVEWPLLPGSYTDGPGNKGEPYCLRTEPPCAPGQTGVGSWTIGPPLPHDAHLSGIPRLTVNVEAGVPEVNVVAFVYDVDEAGNAALVTRGAALASPPAAVEVELYTQDWLLRRGHRLAVLIAGADDFWFEAGRSEATVEVTGGTASLPFLTIRRDRSIPGGPSQAIRERTTFPVPANALATRAAPAGAGIPPQLARRGKKPRLTVTHRPRRVRAGRRTTLTVRVRVGRTPVRRARVRLGRRTAFTDARGRARLRIAPRRAGRFQVRVYRRGTGARRLVVKVLR